MLVIDVGGTRKVRTGRRAPVKIVSGPTLTSRRMVTALKRITAGEARCRGHGYPGAAAPGALHEPHNLGPLGVRRHRAFGKPVKLVNDAAMQALGSYRGRMLFLGLGTGPGSALVVDGVVEPMELAHLPYKKGRTYEDYVGGGLERLGKKKWGGCRDVGLKLKYALQEDLVLAAARSS
jgi:hypothetical protein